MARLSSAKTSVKKTIPYLCFGRKNFLYMLAGCLVIALGYVMMMGGRVDKATFNPDEMYSFTRITLAPFMILGGFAILSWGILRKDTSAQPK